MSVSRPRTVDEAVAVLAEHPDAQPLAGGTDLVVETNLGHRRPERIVGLRRIDELRDHRVANGTLELGATVTYGDVETTLADEAPGLAMASRTVGSPQIRNAGTIGGNLGTASPAGDTLPWLLALDAEVELVSAEGSRRLPLADFITGPKRTARRPDELIRAVRARRVAGPQHTAKIGPRNAMVISIACLSLILDTDHQRVRVGFGAVAPMPVRPHEAEERVSAAVDWDRLTCPDDAVAAFAEACAEATSPITDHRSTAEYRRHAARVLADRALRRCLAA